MPTPYSNGYHRWRCPFSALNILNSKANHTEEGIITQPLFWLQHADFPLQNGVKQNPIYFFYEVWDINSEGNIRQPGDKHYWCYHGTHKFLLSQRRWTTAFTVSSFLHVESILSWLPLSGLIGHICTHFKPMHNLYLIMKQWDTPTNDEILIASGKNNTNSQADISHLCN